MEKVISLVVEVTAQCGDKQAKLCDKTLEGDESRAGGFQTRTGRD